MRIHWADLRAIRALDAPADSLAAKGFTPAAPVNDLLGLRDEPHYLAWLEVRWGSELASPRRAKALVRKGVVDEFVGFAEAVKAGRPPFAELGVYASRVKVQTPTRLVAPDLPSLAAYSMMQVITGSRLRVETCPECGRPRFKEPGGRPYCYRPAPGLAMTCAQAHSHELFAEKRAAWNREYRRIYQRKLRGSVTQAEWDEWRSSPFGSADAPERYRPFDVWKVAPGGLPRVRPIKPGE